MTVLVAEEAMGVKVAHSDLMGQVLEIGSLFLCLALEVIEEAHHV